MSVQKLIQQLDNKNYSNLVQQMNEKNATKFLFLLSNYRQNNLDDEQLIEELKITPTAFYTLKSRLADKVQDFLYKKTKDNRIQLLRNVANIENLVYRTQRETAIIVLKKLETELLEADMANELIIVYNALKKLHIHSQKFYDYSALYNKFIAVNLAQDKAEELLCSFCKTLGDYYLCRDISQLEILILHKREMENVCKLYNSHYLKVYKNILNIHFSLFCPVDKETKNDETVEHMLKEASSIIKLHLEHPTYRHLTRIIDFLYFEYYHALKLYKDANIYYEKLDENLQPLLLCSHSAFSFHFFISKIEYEMMNKNASMTFSEVFNNFPVNEDDIPSYTLFKYFKAQTEFYSNHCMEGITILNKLINKMHFASKPFIEIELKLFLALLHVVNGTHHQADTLVQSLNRKMLKENDKTKLEILTVLLKLLRLALSPIAKNKYIKMEEQYRYFSLINTGPHRTIGFVYLDEKNLKLISQFGKNGNRKKKKKEETKGSKKK